MLRVRVSLIVRVRVSLIARVRVSLMRVSLMRAVEW